MNYVIFNSQYGRRNHVKKSSSYILVESSSPYEPSSLSNHTMSELKVDGFKVLSFRCFL